ncbi:sugar kinase [Gammaproteobacteria bacterium]|nr:sugar kinase [Gammaproteobacteria bacterium]
MTIKLAALGECLIEISELDIKTNENIKKFAYGGDVLNTSVYLSRNNIKTSFISALGNDINSHWLLGEWQKENIDCSLVQKLDGYYPGLYMIELDDNGERSFMYWRNNSAAKNFFENIKLLKKTLLNIKDFDYIYFSGITLAIMSEEVRGYFINYLKIFRQNGGKVIFDSNYRSILWKTQYQAKSNYTKAYKNCDIALPTYDDEKLLFNYKTKKECVQAIQKKGVKDIVLKLGKDGCFYLDEGKQVLVSTGKVKSIDTTGAGDSFNAGYIAAIINGKDKNNACKYGNSIAKDVIRKKGAII